MNNKESSDGWSLDHTKKVTHVSLCSGYGGIDLGLRRCINMRTIAYAEIEAFAVELLLARMEEGQLDAAPIWTDLKSFPWSSFRGKVDILSGGYPCQPFSAAGKRLGKDDPRHLWPWIADGISAMRPRVCFFENVEGHISLGLSTVISDLEELGYKVSWGIFSASECLDASGRTAPHQRKRVFILAHCEVKGLEGHAGLLPRCNESGRQSSEQKGSFGWSNSPRDVWPSRPGEQQFGWEPPRVVGNATEWQDNGRESRDMGLAPSQGRCGDHAADCTGEGVGDTDSRGQSSSIDTRCGGQTIVGGQSDLEPSERGQTEPALGRDADGTAGGVGDAELFASCDNRTDELRLLGNGVVPQTAEVAWRVLVDELINHKETER